MAEKDRKTMVEAQIASWDVLRILIYSKNTTTGRHDLTTEHDVMVYLGCRNLCQRNLGPPSQDSFTKFLNHLSCLLTILLTHKRVLEGMF